MHIHARPLPDSFLINPNRENFFGEVRNGENYLEIVGTFTFKDIAAIHLTRLGAIGLQFLEGGPLASIVALRTSGSGMEPDHVTQNRAEVTDLQGRRVVFANFIAAALFGRISALRRSALSGAQYAGMDEIVGFGRTGSFLTAEQSRHADAAISPKIRFAHEQSGRMRIIPADQITEAIAFMHHLAQRGEEFEQANLQACMVMNYQAAILHNEQHSAASLALNFAVAEALINEIFIAYGIAGGRPPKAFAARSHTCLSITDAQLSRFPAIDKINRLKDGGLIDSYLHQRLNEARDLRNGLMHSAASVNTTQAGTLQTAIRDLWAYLLDREFELNAGWSMRI